MKMVLLFLALVSSCFGAALSGTVKNQDGSLFNGTITLYLEKTATIVSQNGGDCSGRIVTKVKPAFIKVTNGVPDNTAQIVPSSCLIPFQPYIVSMIPINSTTAVWTTRWFIAPAANNPLLSPSTGNKWLYDVGFLSLQVFNQYAPGSFAIVTSKQLSISSRGSTIVTLKWPFVFTDTTYTTLCIPSTGHYSVSALTVYKGSISFTVSKGISSPSTETGYVVCIAHE